MKDIHKILILLIIGVMFFSTGALIRATATHYEKEVPCLDNNDNEIKGQVCLMSYTESDTLQHILISAGTMLVFGSVIFGILITFAEEE